MPPPVAFTQEQRVKMVEKLKASPYGSCACQACQGDDWTIIDSPLELKEYHGGAVVFGTGVVPVIGFVCNVCGTIRFVSAIAAGIIDAKGKVIDE